MSNQPRGDPQHVLQELDDSVGEFQRTVKMAFDTTFLGQSTPLMMPLLLTVHVDPQSPHVLSGLFDLSFAFAIHGTHGDVHTKSGRQVPVRIFVADRPS